MISEVVTVSATPTLIIAADNKWRSITMHNPSGVKIYLGGSNVSTSNGLHLDNGETLTLEMPLGETLYAIVTANTHDLVILKPDLD